MCRRCYCFVEDAPTAEVAIRLLAHRNGLRGSELGFVNGSPNIMQGFGKIKRNVSAFINMARAGSPVFVIVDLDTTPCPPELLTSWLPAKPTVPRELVFRVAVRQVESWILADRSSLASFLAIPVANFPERPDELANPKRALLDLIRTKGKRKWHREMLPQSRTASIGPRYNERVCTFVSDHWDPLRASDHSPSLRRAMSALLAL